MREALSHLATLIFAGAGLLALWSIIHTIRACWPAVLENLYVHYLTDESDEAPRDF